MPSRGQQLGKLLNTSGDIVETSLPPKIETFSQSVSNTGKIEASALGDDVSTIEQVSDINSLSATGNAVGDQRVVGNNLYIWNGSGWFRIALINETPTWDSGGQPSGSYVLDADSPQDATTITLAASDPEGFPISYSYVTSGSMDSMATISQDSSVFTITPKTFAQLGEGTYTGSITFRASDGVNILPQVSSFTLNFITIIENSRYTTLLATAVDTSDNNDITDSSTNNYTITVNGDAQAGTFSPYRHGGYSTYFPDSGWGPYTDNVIAPSSDFAFGTGAFTVSFWYKFEHSFSSEIFDTRQTSVNMNGFRIWIGPAGGATVYYATSTVLTATTTAAVGVWGHICVTRDGSGNLKIFLNGTQAASITDNNNYTAQGLNIGNSNSGINDFRGWMKDIHVVKGYSYEPDTVSIYSPAKVGVGTVFLGCTTASMQDVSTAARTISSSIGFTYTTEVPNNNLEYSAAVHGGSVYFDGTGDYWQVSSPPTLAANDWTFETWWYQTAGGTIRFMDQGGGSNSHVSSFAYSNSYGGYTLQTWTGNNVVLFQPTITLSNNQWYHVALTYDNNTSSYTLYHNGISLGNSGSVGNNVWNTGNIAGQPLAANIYKYNNTVGSAAYFSDWRLSDSVVYTNNFTPPTTPLSSSGSLLHVKGTEASIIDKSQGSNLKLVGNTTGSTTEVKFAGSKSMYFDGSGDYVTISDLELSGDLTIEGWFYQSTAQSATFRCITGSSTYTSPGSTPVRIYTYGSDVRAYVTSTIYISGSFTANSWHHVALVRSSGTWTLYIDGVSAGTNTTSGAYNFASTTDWYIGASGPDGYPFTGYSQDVRFSKGLARYTGNFTPPTAPLKG